MNLQVRSSSLESQTAQHTTQQLNQCLTHKRCVIPLRTNNQINSVVTLFGKTSENDLAEKKPN